MLTGLEPSEHDFQEFKGSLFLADGDQIVSGFQAALSRQASAFANGAGGRIFIGVDDAGRIDGGVPTRPSTQTDRPGTGFPHSRVPACGRESPASHLARSDPPISAQEEASRQSRSNGVRCARRNRRTTAAQWFCRLGPGRGVPR